MDIRVNDDTITKKTVNMKLKRKYPKGRLTSRWEQHIRKKSHERKICDRRQTWLPGGPHESGNNKEVGS
jgi:hypothetical protein